MRHLKKNRKLKRDRAHRRMLLRNLTTALFLKERIVTTKTKALEARRYAEKMISMAKENTLASSRQVAGFVIGKEAVKRLLKEIAPRFQGRNGGYTRIIKMSPRKSDGAEMAILELVIKEEKKEKPKKKEKKK